MSTALLVYASVSQLPKEADLEVVYKILSIGAIGLGFFLACMAYRLLAKEQSRPEPRKLMLNAIYIFMAFSLALAGLGVLSEVIGRNKPVERTDNTEVSKGSAKDSQETQKTPTADLTKSIAGKWKYQQEDWKPDSFQLWEISQNGDEIRVPFDKYGADVAFGTFTYETRDFRLHSTSEYEVLGEDCQDRASWFGKLAEDGETIAGEWANSIKGEDRVDLFHKGRFRLVRIH